MMKFVVCTGMICGTNFGMEKEQAIARVPQQKIYTQYNYTLRGRYGGYVDLVLYRKIASTGFLFDMKSSTQSKVESAIRFKSCSLVLQNQKYYVKTGVDYGLSIVIEKAKNILDADLVPVELTREQLETVIRLIDTKEEEVFVLDEYDNQLEIVDVSPEVRSTVDYTTSQMKKDPNYHYTKSNPDITTY